MNRQTALFLSLIIFIIYISFCYYGAKITLFSSITFSLLLSIILSSIFYPISQLTMDPADATLIIYAIYYILCIIILCSYITIKCFCDEREDYKVFLN